MKELEAYPKKCDDIFSPLEPFEIRIIYRWNKGPKTNGFSFNRDGMFGDALVEFLRRVMQSRGGKTTALRKKKLKEQLC